MRRHGLLEYPSRDPLPLPENLPPISFSEPSLHLADSGLAAFSAVTAEATGDVSGGPIDHRRTRLNLSATEFRLIARAASV